LLLPSPSAAYKLSGREKDTFNSVPTYFLSKALKRIAGGMREALSLFGYHLRTLPIPSFYFRRRN